eukprot:scaffold120662_cov32-Prasinocladus_malaysianus.AAC.2
MATARVHSNDCGRQTTETIGWRLVLIETAEIDECRPSELRGCSKSALGEHGSLGEVGDCGKHLRPGSLVVVTRGLVLLGSAYTTEVVGGRLVKPPCISARWELNKRDIFAIMKRYPEAKEVLQFGVMDRILATSQDHKNTTLL